MDIVYCKRERSEALPTTMTKAERQASDAKEALHGRQPMFYMLLKVVNKARFRDFNST